MKIYILRHGIAENFNPGGDPSRSLTKEGMKKVEEIAQFLNGKISPDVILTSPYVRAVQTAEIAADVFGMKKKVENSDALLPGRDSEDTLIELKARNENEVFLVGHNPHLSDLASDLISDGAAYLQLKKASVTCIEFSGTPVMGRGILKWLITPGVLGL